MGRAKYSRPRPPELATVYPSPRAVPTGRWRRGGGGGGGRHLHHRHHHHHQRRRRREEGLHGLAGGKVNDSDDLGKHVDM